MDVRVFKILSGEVVIGKLSKSLVEDTRPLSKRDSFVIESPVLLHFNGQGFGLAPLYPWSDPKKGATATFPGTSILCEADTRDVAHDAIVREYSQIVSRIQIAANAIPPTSGLQFN